MPSFLVARTRLSPAGQAELVAGCARARLVRGGCALEFADGCDALFLVAPSGPETAGTVASAREEFSSLDAGRERVLRGLRHFAADRGIALWRSRSGRWPARVGGVTANFEVGASLTRALMQSSPERALSDTTGWWFKLSPEEARVWLSKPGLPGAEAPWLPDGQSPELLPGAKVAALMDSSLCSEPVEEFPVRLQAALGSETQQVLDLVVARVGPQRFTWQIQGPGFGELEFSDGADRLRLVTRGRRWAARLRESGVPVLATEIADRFERLDRARSQFLQLVRHFAASQDWRLFHETSIIEQNASWGFGRKSGVAKLQAGRSLTLQLERSAPRALFLTWLDSQGLPQPDEATLLAWENSAAPVLVERPAVEMRPIEECLPAFAGDSLAALDQVAAERLTEFRERLAASPDGRICGESIHLLRRARRWFAADLDDWATESWWLELARQAWSARGDREAGVELLWAGDEAPRAALLEHVGNYQEYFNEAFSIDELRVLRAALPWPVPEDMEEARWSRVPWPAMDRRLSMDCREALQAFASETEVEARRDRRRDALEAAKNLSKAGAEEWLAAEEIDLLRQALLEWAGENDFPSLLGGAEELEIAARFGWLEVQARLEANPDFVPAQFLNREEALLFTPGAVAARLSSLGPSHLVERFAALALTRGDRQPELGRSSVHSAKLAALMSAAQLAEMDARFDAHRAAALALDRWAGAIAWQRCRKARSSRR